MIPNRRVLFLLIALLIAGCSSTTFFYNRLHVFIPWYVDDYVDLNSRQDDTLELLLVDYMDRHRTEHLPRYVEIIDTALASLDQAELDGAVMRLYQQAEEELQQVQRESLEWMLTLGDQLTEKQMREFIASLYEKQEEYREEYLERDEDEFRDETRESLEENLTDYLGRLGSEQEAILDEAVANMHRWDRLWLAEREQWIDRLSAALARRPGWKQEVRGLVADRYQRVTPEYRRAFEHNRSLILGAVAAAVELRSQRQERHLRRELGSLREDLCTLIGQAEGETATNRQRLSTLPCSRGEISRIRSVPHQCLPPCIGSRSVSRTSGGWEDPLSASGG